MIPSKAFPDLSIEPFMRMFVLSYDLEDLKKFEKSLDKQMSELISFERIERDYEGEERLIRRINRKYSLHQAGT